MMRLIHCWVAGIGLFVAAAGAPGGYPVLWGADRAAENTAAVPKDAIDSLMARVDEIGRDREMTTAKKAAVAAEAMEKFNQQYKGKLLTVRLKIQDVVPYEHGHYFTASHPDLEGVQFYAAKFHANLSSADIISVTKDSVLAVTGAVSAGHPARTGLRSMEIHKPGGSIAFPSHAASACQICLDNITYQIDVGPKTSADVRSAGTTSGVTPADKTRSEQTRSERTRSVDDIKLFFLKGIFQDKHPSGTTNTNTTGRIGTGQSPSLTTRPGFTTVPAKTRHNRIYTAAELIQKFGSPSSRSSTGTEEKWAYKCKDGVVHLHFTQVGFHSSLATKSETLRLEIKSVDASSSTSRY